MQRPAHLHFLNIYTLTWVLLPPRVLAEAMHREALTGHEKPTHGITFHFLVANRNDIEKPLGMRSIIGKIIFSCMHLNRDVTLKVTNFRRIKGDVIPTGNRRRKIVIVKDLI